MALFVFSAQQLTDVIAELQRRRVRLRLLADAGFDLPTSSRGLLTFNVGAIVAAVLVSWVILFTGSRLPMLIMALGGAGGALALSRMGFDPGAPKWLLMTALAARELDEPSFAAWIRRHNAAI